VPLGWTWVVGTVPHSGQVVQEERAALPRVRTVVWDSGPGLRAEGSPLAVIPRPLGRGLGEG